MSLKITHNIRTISPCLSTNEKKKKIEETRVRKKNALKVVLGVLVNLCRKPNET